MTRTISIGKRYADDLESKLRVQFPNKCVEIYIVEHGTRVRVEVRDVRGLKVEESIVEELSSSHFRKAPYNRFDFPNAVVLYYSFGSSIRRPAV